MADHVHVVPGHHDHACLARLGLGRRGAGDDGPLKVRGQHVADGRYRVVEGGELPAYDLLELEGVGRHAVSHGHEAVP